MARAKMRSEWNKKQVQRGKQTRTRALKLLWEGNTPSEVAKQIHVSAQHVRYLIRRMRTRDPAALPEAYRFGQNNKHLVGEQPQLDDQHLKENQMDDRDREVVNSRMEAHKERFDRLIFELKTGIDGQLRELTAQVQQARESAAAMPDIRREIDEILRKLSEQVKKAIPQVPEGLCKTFPQMCQDIESIRARLDKVPDDLCSRWPEVCANWPKVTKLIAIHDTDASEPEINHTNFQDYLDCPECGPEAKEQAKAWAKKNLGELFDDANELAEKLRERGFTVVRQAPQQKRSLI